MTTKLDTYVDWLVRRALPVWAEQGFDAGAGRFRERLDRDGRPIELPHRAMVQARQIFVFAHAAEQGWYKDGARLAETAMAALLRDFSERAGDETSFAFAIAPSTGTVISPVRDAYAHAFILFAIAALYRLNGDSRLLDLADSIIRFVERRLGDPVHLGLFDALPAPAEKRQNPHMHLLEAYLFLERAAPGRGYITRACGLVDLFKRRFFRGDVLLEYFAADWTPSPGATWEPGHHFEWVGLLGDYGALTGEDMLFWSDALYAAAITRGIAADGLILDELSGDDQSVRKASHRVWPHTEAIRAAATRHDVGDPNAHAFADRMAASLLDTFLDTPFAGGWVDHVAADGASLVDYVPASSLYHLTLAGSIAAKGFSDVPALAKASP